MLCSCAQHFHNVSLTMTSLNMKNLSIVLLLCNLALTNAWISPVQHVVTSPVRLTPTTGGLSAYHTETEPEARWVLSKATQVAYSDDNNESAEDLRALLREMIHLQSGCVVGTLVGPDICDNQDFVAEIVQRLQQKLQEKESTGHQRVGLRFGDR